MLRRSAFLFRTSLTEAARLLSPALDLKAQPTLTTTLEILADHGAAAVTPSSDAAERQQVVSAAMQRLVRLDITSLDSNVIAKCQVPVKQTVTTTTSSSAAVPTTTEGEDDAEKENVIVAVMRANPNCPLIRERCCRCVANMSLLSLPHAGGTPSIDVAEQLVKCGAVPLVLGTMQMAERLTPSGRSWAAMALLNLLCLSSSGLRAAVESSHSATHVESAAVEGVTAVILSVLDDEMFTQSLLSSSTATQTFPAQSVATLDAAVGSLSVLLQAEVPENAKKIHYFYQAASYASISAVIRTVLSASTLLVRDGKHEGGIVTSSRHGNRDIHPVQLMKCSSQQVSAVATLLPLLHKAWMALRLFCRHPPNVPLVVEALLEAAGTAETQLPTLMAASLFAVVELEGLGEFKPLQSLCQVQEELTAATLEVLAVLARPPAVDEAATVSAASVSNIVSEVLRTGTASSIALSTLVRVHAGQRSREDSNHDQKGIVWSYDATALQLIVKSLELLRFLSEGEPGAADEVVTSANTLAALDVVLSSGIETLKDIAAAGPLGMLFKPAAAEDMKDEAQKEEGKSDSVASAQSHTFLQESAILGQVCAIYFSLLRQPPAAQAILENHLAGGDNSSTGLLPLVAELREVLKEYSESAAAAQSSESTAAGENVKCLVDLSGKLHDSLTRLVSSSSSSQ